MYRPVPCTQEQLLPTRWILSYPTRQQVADHLRRLRERFGTQTAMECKRRMLWVGVFPTQSMKTRDREALYAAAMADCDRSGGNPGGL